MRQLTEDQKTKAAERKERFRTLVRQVAAMTDEQRADLAAGMAGLITCESHALSLHNACLIASQFAGATVVGGFRQWLKHGRCVAKGQRGLMIWVPIKGKAKEGTEEQDLGETHFIAGTVFDISQTVEVGTPTAEVAVA